MNFSYEKDLAILKEFLDTYLSEGPFRLAQTKEVIDLQGFFDRATNDRGLKKFAEDNHLRFGIAEIKGIKELMIFGPGDLDLIGGVELSEDEIQDMYESTGKDVEQLAKDIKEMTKPKKKTLM